MKGFRANVLVLTTVLFLVGGAAVFAGGQKETPSQQAPTGATAQATVAKEVTTVTGTVQIVNLIHPVIKSGATSYELIVPRIDVYQAGVQEGQSITVKGYKVEGDVWGPYFQGTQTADTTPKLLVSSATVDGKTFDLQRWADQFKLALQYRGTYGPGYGNRGPGYAPMMGYGRRDRDDRGPQRGYGMGYGPGPGYGPRMGYGMGPGFGAGMGYRFQDNNSSSN